MAYFKVLSHHFALEHSIGCLYNTVLLFIAYTAVVNILLLHYVGKSSTSGHRSAMTRLLNFVHRKY